MGTLYLCATPIGNLEDITLRVLRTLKEVDLIAAEDTRQTIKLLNHFDIKTPLTSYHEHNKFQKTGVLVNELLAGKNIAVVTDAGTPAISDPGAELALAAYEAGIPVTSLPGASAVITALTLGGLPTRRFAFEGFLSTAKSERDERLTELQNEVRTMIFYEAPHKIGATLRDLAAALGDREIAIVREITKIHEEVIRTTLCAAAEKYADGGLKGEIVLIIAGAKPEEKEQMAVEQAVEEAKKFIASGDSASEAAKKAAKLSGHKKGDIYKLLQGEKDNG